MTDYIGNALAEINPCGVIRIKSGREKIESACKYFKKCEEWTGRDKKSFCVSQFAYRLAKSLAGGKTSVDAERKELSDFLGENLGNFVDPEKPTWEISQLTGENLGEVVDLIVTRGIVYYQKACSLGSSRNPLNFYCSNRDIVNDLF